MARGLVQLAVYDLPDDTFSAFTPRIRALTADEVTRAARQYIQPDRAVVVAVGDSARIRGALEQAGLGEAAVVTADL